MNDLCGISATPRGRGNEEVSVETRFRGQCRSQSWNQYGPVLGYRSRLLGFHRSLGSEAVSSSGVRWVPWVPTRARGGIADDLWTVCMPVGRAPQRLLLRRRSESSQAVSLGLVTTELVINALKHAFAPGYEGEIVVRYDVDGAGWRLSVSDNGVGRRDDGHERGGGGLGTSIVEALSHQLNARTELSAGSQGTIVSIIHVA